MWSLMNILARCFKCKIQMLKIEFQPALKVVITLALPTRHNFS